jgi:hypothetical protein
MRLSLKELTIIAALGALWGSVEMTLGSFLHVLNVPFTGAVLGSIGICIALVGRVVVPRPGSTLSIAVIAALLKALSIGGVVLSPMIAIVMEGLLADLVLSLGGRPRRSTFILAGAVAVAWNTLHMVLIQGVVFGAGIIAMYVTLIRKAAMLFHIPASSVFAVLVILVAMHVVAGSVAGLIAWEAGRSVVARRSLVELDAGGPT